MSRLVIEFGSNRETCGRLTFFDEGGKGLCGSFAVAGRASDDLAAAHGNPARNPLLRYGDTPTGGYVVRQLVPSGRGTQFESAQYGSYGVVVLEGISGDAACAEANGRFHILICGGKLSPKGQLRSTAGALRLCDEDQRKLFAALKKRKAGARCEIVEDASVPCKAMVFDDPACAHQDPPSLRTREVRPRSRSREMLRGGAAGAMMFSFTVSFVALQRSTLGHAAASAQDTASVLKMSKIPAGALPARHYVKLAYNTGGAAPASGAMQQLQNATSGTKTTGQTFDNGPGPSDATPSGGGTVSVPQSQPAPEPPVTPQQQQMLNNDQQYQQFEQQYSNAQKAVSDAAAHEQQIQTQMSTTTDSARKAQLQVDLVKARQDESNANSAANAAKINAQERKKVIIQGAPIKQD